MSHRAVWELGSEGPRCLGGGWYDLLIISSRVCLVTVLPGFLDICGYMVLHWPFCLRNISAGFMWLLFIPFN